MLYFFLTEPEKATQTKKNILPKTKPNKQQQEKEAMGRPKGLAGYGLCVWRWRRSIKTGGTRRPDDIARCYLNISTGIYHSNLEAAQLLRSFPGRENVQIIKPELLDSQLLPKRVTKKEARGTTPVRRSRGVLSRNYRRKTTKPRILPVDIPTGAHEDPAENGKCSGVGTVLGVQEASSSLHKSSRSNPDIKVEHEPIDEEDWVDVNENGESEILDEESNWSRAEDNEYILL